MLEHARKYYAYLTRVYIRRYTLVIMWLAITKMQHVLWNDINSALPL